MSFDLTMRSGSKLLRCGYTTGTCAALAASGAVDREYACLPGSSHAQRYPRGGCAGFLPDGRGSGGMCGQKRRRG